MLHLYWGNGKGKTTAAMGLALRALGHGRRVVIVQFLKDGTSGEIAPLRAAGAAVYACPNAKFTWLMDEADKAAAREASARALGQALAEPFDLLVLDEACAALKSSILDEDPAAPGRRLCQKRQGSCADRPRPGPLAARHRRLLDRDAGAQAPLRGRRCRTGRCGILNRIKQKRGIPKSGSSPLLLFV